MRAERLRGHHGLMNGDGAPCRPSATRHTQSRIEQWKYTDLRGALEGQVAAVSPKQILHSDRNPFAAVSAFQLSIADGCSQVPSSQIPLGIEMFDLGQLDDGAPDWVRQNYGEVLSRSAMGEASLAMMRGGIAMRVTAVTTPPVHLDSCKRRTPFIAGCCW